MPLISRRPSGKAGVPVSSPEEDEVVIGIPRPTTDHPKGVPAYLRISGNSWKVEVSPDDKVVAAIVESSKKLGVETRGLLGTHIVTGDPETDELVKNGLRRRQQPSGNDD